MFKPFLKGNYFRDLDKTLLKKCLIGSNRNITRMKI